MFFKNNFIFYYGLDLLINFLKTLNFIFNKMVYKFDLIIYSIT